MSKRIEIDQTFLGAVRVLRVIKDIILRFFRWRQRGKMTKNAKQWKKNWNTITLKHCKINQKTEEKKSINMYKCKKNLSLRSCKINDGAHTKFRKNSCKAKHETRYDDGTKWRFHKCIFKDLPACQLPSILALTIKINSFAYLKGK